MAAIQKKRFNWLPKASAWQEMQAWRERRQAVSDSYATTSANAASGFSAVWDAQAVGSTQITVNRVNQRMQAALQARINNINVLT